MTKTVHYIDQPFEAILKCLPFSDDPAGKNRIAWESEMRGKPVAIIFPMVANAVRQYEHYTCQGPFYYHASRLDSTLCIHIINWIDKPKEQI